MEGKKVIVLGAGLPGLSAAHWLTRQSVETEILERASEPGGLARTVDRGGFRFDLAGYRFFSRTAEIHHLLHEILGEDLLSVRASSRIYFRGRLYEYPLAPRDIYAGFGAQKAGLALWSFTGSRIANALRFGPPMNLEEWLLGEFGETIFRAFFRDYNEKVWGLPCHRLAAELASQRIRGMSLTSVFAQALLPKKIVSGEGTQHSFLYPRLGIGQLTDRFATAIQRRNRIRTDATVTEVRVKRGRVETVVYHDPDEGDVEVAGTDVISSIPLPRLVFLLNPRPPADVLASARSLNFRDLIVVCLEIKRDRVTDGSWIYVPEPGIAFARVLEPKNWSPAMAPPDRTSLVAEHYCFEGDQIWSETDEDLVGQTITDLAEKLKLISREEVVGGCAIRIKKPYPVYEIGYREHLTRIQRYLHGIVNLQTVGRGGMFKYYNVGHLVESGIRAAENVFGAGHDLAGVPVNGVVSATFQD